MQNEARWPACAGPCESFTGPQQFAQYQVMSKIGPALSEIFASDESEFAKLFADYLTPQTGKTAKPAEAPGGGPMRVEQP